MHIRFHKYLIIRNSEYVEMYIYIMRVLSCPLNKRKSMFKPCYDVISLESQDQAKTSPWDRVAHIRYCSHHVFPKMACVTWLNAIIHSWSRTFPTISSFMGATLSNKLIQRIVLNMWEDLCKKYWVFDNIWGQDLQHTFTLSQFWTESSRTKDQSSFFKSCPDLQNQVVCPSTQCSVVIKA